MPIYSLDIEQEIKLPTSDETILRFKGEELGVIDENGTKYAIYKTSNPKKSGNYVLHIDRYAPTTIGSGRYSQNKFKDKEEIVNYIKENRSFRTSKETRVELLELLGIERPVECLE